MLGKKGGFFPAIIFARPFLEKNSFQFMKILLKLNMFGIRRIENCIDDHCHGT